MSVAENLCAYYHALQAGGLPTAVADEIIVTAARAVHQLDIDSSSLVSSVTDVAGGTANG